MYFLYKLFVLLDKIFDNIIRNVEIWEEKYCKYFTRYIKIYLKFNCFKMLQIFVKIEYFMFNYEIKVLFFGRRYVFGNSL